MTCRFANHLPHPLVFSFIFLFMGVDVEDDRIAKRITGRCNRLTETSIIFSFLCSTAGFWRLTSPGFLPLLRFHGFDWQFFFLISLSLVPIINPWNYEAIKKEAVSLYHSSAGILLPFPLLCPADDV